MKYLLITTARRTGRLLLLLLLWPEILVAQLQTAPLPYTPRALQLMQIRAARTMTDSTRYPLPFWDDFSRSRLVPDSSRWFLSSGSPNIKPGSGINPPSLNVAVFDGWDVYGRPYQSTALAQGPADSLVSRFIDLELVPQALRNTVYLSFFWQKEGRGEQPDAADSLRLQFRTADGNWTSVWSVRGQDATSSTQFTQQLVAIDQSAFFHPWFQFRFQNFGRLSGGYDTWNIDYIFINSGRSGSDRAFDDRALTGLPGSFIPKYTGMPFDHFRVNLENNVQGVAAEFYNLDSQVQPTEYSALLRDTSRIYDIMDQFTVLDPNPLGFERRRIESKPVNPAAFLSLPDSSRLNLETYFHINSGDTIRFGTVDFRANDTARTYILLDRELSYDDGSAEWAAGINQNGGQLAYRFVAAKPDAITELRIFFPEYLEGNAGRTITLIVWDHLSEGVEGRLLTEQHVIQPSTGPDQFASYRLGRPVVVSDTFYVGYLQNTSDFFGVGLDKNTDSGSEIFYNTSGTWEANTRISGSLMIRPVFGFRQAVGLDDDVALRDIRVYPNPATGYFIVEGSADRISLCDVQGRELMRAGPVEDFLRMEVPQHLSGIYLVRLWQGQRIRTFKLMVRP
jgi:hypothetical protein